MFNNLKTAALLITSLILFSHQPPVKAELEEPLPVLQPGLIAVEGQIQVWSTGPDVALQPAPLLLPTIPLPILPTVASPNPDFAPLLRSIIAAAAPTQASPADSIAIAGGSLSPSTKPYWPESAVLLARLSAQGSVPTVLHQLLTTNTCRNCNLRGANLQNAMLMNADLTGADLSAADLREADLRGAKLNNASLAGANLSGAIMPNGILHQ